MQKKNKISVLLRATGELLKCRLSAAVTFSAITGYFIFKSEPGSDLIFLTLGLFLTAGGSAALNQFTEGSLDGLMERTKRRPVPSSIFSKGRALTISLISISAGLSLLLINGFFPLLLGLINIILYNLIYTKLKKISPLALIPGSLVGAIPPLIGYTSAGGTNPDAGILIFSGFMFLWQIPHFWLIGLRYSADYRRAGFRFNDLFRNKAQTKAVVFIWILFSTILLGVISLTGLLFERPLYFMIIPLNILFIMLFYASLFGSENERNTKAAFILINSFSIMMMVFFIINSFLASS